MREIEVYRGQDFYRVNLFGLVRKLPLVKVRDGLWIASNAEIILGETEFIERAAEELANRIRRFNPEVLVTAEVKSIALAFQVSKLLGHRKFVIARKSIKAYMRDYIVEKVSSITTKGSQILLLTAEAIKYVRGRRVCIIDDVVSTGGTIRALRNLVLRAGGEVVCKAAIWKEGPWYRDEDLIYIAILPIFVEEDKAKEFEF